MWYMYTLKCYSAIKRNEIEPVVVMWMNLELVIQGKVRKRKIGYINAYIQGI